MKGLYGGHESMAGIGSLVIHVAAVALLLFVGTLKPVQKAVKEFVPLFAPRLKRFSPNPSPNSPRAVAEVRKRWPQPRANFPRWLPSRLFLRFER